MSPTSRGERRRCEVWWVAFDPSLGGEIRRTRPALIVSNDVAKRLLNCVQVVPLTRSTPRLYPGEAYVIVEGLRRKAMADQLPPRSCACVAPSAFWIRAAWPPSNARCGRSWRSDAVMRHDR